MVGAIKVLRQLGILRDDSLIAGASSGALSASAVCSGVSDHHLYHGVRFHHSSRMGLLFVSLFINEQPAFKTVGATVCLSPWPLILTMNVCVEDARAHRTIARAHFVT